LSCVNPPRLFCVGLALLCALVFVLSTGCARQTRVSGALPQEVFVWQRVWNSNVEDALKNARASAARFCVLVGEIDVREREPRIFQPNVGYAALKASGVPVALAIRIDPFAGAFAGHDAKAEAIVNLARDAVATARAQAVQPAELQIDFDCGEWKLAGYRKWLRQIREAVAPLPVTPTMLPSWLKHSEFRDLARDCGGFILQVHSVAVPRTIQETRALTEPRQAIAWVEQAARIGVAFRVSLPTYSYLVAFGTDGKFRGVSAEGPSARWPADAHVVRWEAQPSDLAELVAQWRRERPATLRGVCWYRLPVASDNLNWSWPTLAAVMAGRAPKRGLQLTASPSQPSEIVAANDGELDEPLPLRVLARWTGAKLIAADALEGYELEPTSTENAVAWRLTAAGEVLRLPPDAQRKIGWVRCEPQTPLQISVAADSGPERYTAPTPRERDRH
jgi:hypothetical protein